MVKNIIIAVVALIAIAGFSLSFTGNESLGGTTSATFTAANLVSQGTLKVGPNGTTFGDVLAGTCSIIGNAPITATTSASFACAVTGVASGDIVLVQSGTTTSSGFFISGASASTTAGYITISVANMSGAAGAVPSSIASSTYYWIVD